MVQPVPSLWIWRVNNDLDNVEDIFDKVIFDQDNDQQGHYDVRIQRWHSSGRCHHCIPCRFRRDCCSFANSCPRWIFI